nr:hypothetical protein [Afipia sp.]
MPASWTIAADWESLDVGSPEERACFAALGIKAQGIWLTEGNDVLANRLRQSPLLSAYHLAEWLAWNWWRLRWEPRSNAYDWPYAHRMATIGSGYIWPNITIFSDGERIALISKPTTERPQTPFRYIADHAGILPASEFESELDLFIGQVIERLDWASISGSNLQTIWASVCEERRVPELARARKLEALLGRDPDAAESGVVEHLVKDIADLGASAVEELAAEHGQSGKILTGNHLRDVATSYGFDAAPKDVARLPAEIGLRIGGQIPAYRVGASAARALREQERFGEKPISSRKLAEIAGVDQAVIDDRRGSPDISFALDEVHKNASRVVLRSKWRSGRRFELARLLGDRLARPPIGRLLPATKAYTYRQKMQRSFAAEFLSPFSAVDEMLAGDYSMESQQDVAEHFDVSPLTIQTLLMNHGRVERDAFDTELESAAAA